MNTWIDLHALWKIVVVGLICGAGLPMVFALGLRALGHRRTGSATSTVDGAAVMGDSPVGLGLAVLCFAVVLAGIGWGIYFIVAGS